MTTEVDIVEMPAHEETSYVDWPAIIAGNAVSDLKMLE
mgnify:CR=1 FL=1